MKPIIFFCVIALLSLNSFSQKTKTQPLDTATIEKITGVKGKSNKGEYKITIPQNDLNVEVDGFKIIPPMGLGTWIAFTPTKDGAMIMGDIILTEIRSEEHTSELQSLTNLVCRLLLEKKKRLGARFRSTS